MESTKPLDAGILKTSHKNFKSQYKNPSKKKSSAMSESIQHGKYRRIAHSLMKHFGCAC